ncbi:peroxynitrite isomerase THAP4 [Ixodes scapularis]
MPSTTCSAVGCSNNPLRNPEVLFHKFPTDRKLQKAWVNAVRRVDFGKPWAPTPRSKLCSDHFSPDSYERDLRVLAACGLSAKGTRLKKDAVPSLFAHRPPAVPARAAYIKRRRIETLRQALESGSSAAACALPENVSAQVSGTQTTKVIVSNKAVQTSAKHGYSSKGVQVSGGNAKSKCTQSSIDTTSRATQTSQTTQEHPEDIRRFSTWGRKDVFRVSLRGSQAILGRSICPVPSRGEDVLETATQMT